MSASVDLALESVTLRTDALPSPRERFDAWRQAVAGTFDVGPLDAAALADFNVAATRWSLGPVVLTSMEFSVALSATRTARMARADQIDHYRVALQTRGPLRVVAGERQLQADTGQIVFTDLARTEHYQHDEGSDILLFLPRELLDEALPRPMDLHGVVPHGPSADMLAEYLRSLVRNLPQMEVSEVQGTRQALIGMIAATLAPTAHTLGIARGSIESTLLRQACRYIELHLTDTSMSAASICGVFKISRATLYRLFEPYGGVAAFIKERRLLQIHHLLSAPRRPGTLTQLAEAHGFATSSHFSRAFREMFGYSPTEAATRTSVPTLAPKGGKTTSGLSLSGLLRSSRD